MKKAIALRALEREDLRFVHELNNDRSVMTYWFEEPYEAFVELESLYDRHIHDQTERRFIAENTAGELVGLVELMEINYIHRSAEFQIIVCPSHQGKGYGRLLMHEAVSYAFRILNLNKLYLLVAINNELAHKLYLKYGFKEEGLLREEFFINGRFEDVIRMSMLQKEFLAMQN